MPGKLATEALLKPKLSVAFQILKLLTILIALIFWFILLFDQPVLHFQYLPDQLSSVIEQGKPNGFSSPESDKAGNRYVWTRDRSGIAFNFALAKPVKMSFEIRSGAVVGGLKGPVVMLVNGVEQGRLQPDPANLDFQRFSLPVPLPLDKRQNLKVELVTPAFVRPEDGQIFGVMVKSIELDQSESWSSITRRLWLLWSLPFLALGGAALFWISRRYRLAIMGYAAAGVCLVGTGFMGLAFVILSQIKLIDQSSNPLWQIGILYLGLFFSIASLSLALRTASIFQHAALVALDNRVRQFPGSILNSFRQLLSLRLSVGWKEQVRPVDNPRLKYISLARCAPVAAPMLVSFGLALVYLLLSQTQPPISDAVLYHDLGKKLAGFPDVQYFVTERQTQLGLYVRGMGYPFFLSLVYRLSGNANVTAVAFIQGLVFLPLTVLLVYLAGRTAFNRRVGLIAAWLLALSLPLVWHSIWIMTETLLGLLLTWLLLVMAQLQKERHARSGLFIGLLLGILSISHSSYQFMPYLVGFAFVVFSLSKFRAYLPALIALTFGIALVLVPYQGYRILNNLPNPGQGGLGLGGGGAWTMYVGSRLSTGGSVVTSDYLLVEKDISTIHDKLQRGEIQLDPFITNIINDKFSKGVVDGQKLSDGDFYQAAIHHWLSNPADIPQLVWLKSNYLFFYQGAIVYPPTPGVVFSSASVQKTWSDIGQGLFWLALGGLFLVALRHFRQLILFVPLVSQAILFVLTYPENRYLYPFFSALMLLVAILIYEVSQFFRFLYFSRLKGIIRNLKVSSTQRGVR